MRRDAAAVICHRATSSTDHVSSARRAGARPCWRDWFAVLPTLGSCYTAAMLRRCVTLLLPLALACASTPQDEATPAAATSACDVRSDRSCIAIERDGARRIRRLTDYTPVRVDDRGTLRTVIRLSDLIDAEIAPKPHTWRFKLYATDGFTHGGHASWPNLQHGFIELKSRRVFFADSEGLPNTYRVRDTYLIELSRAE